MFAKLETMEKHYLELESDLDLTGVLADMGMELAFDPVSADFGNMARLEPYWNVCIDQVLHKTWMKIDAQGTEAAAATAVIMTEAAMAAPEEEPPKVVILDRPYVMGIWDTETHSILFVGAVNHVG